MPGNHGEISVDEHNDNKKTRKKKKKKKDVKEIGISDDFENGNQLVTPSISKTSKGFTAKLRKKPKSSSTSCSGSRKVGCFCVRRPRRTEDECSSSSSPPPSDPNDESFTHEMLRVMLETNDFCSSECNPHL